MDAGNETVIMKIVIKNTSELFRIIRFSFSLLLQTSIKYFSIRIILNIISLAVPFVVISLTRLLIDFLVENVATSSALFTIMQPFLTLTVLLLCLNILNKAVETINTYYIGLHRDTMNTATKHLIIEKAAELDLSYFDSNAFYNEMSDANANSPLVTQSAFQTIDLFRYLIQFLIAFTYLFQFNLVLPFVFLISIIPSAVTQEKQLKAVYNFQREHMSEDRKMQYAADVLTSQEFAKDVRAYSIFPFISNKFLTIWNTLFSKKRKISLRYTRTLLVLSALPEAAAAAILFLLGLSVIRGTHTMGDYVFFQGIMAQVLGSVYMVIFSYTQLMDGKMRIQNYIKFLGFKNKLCMDGTSVLTKSSFTIEFRNVCFRYDNNLPWVLKNVSFTIHSFQKVALVGENGSGKTTIIKLLLRFYDPVEGQILINGRDIREYELDSVRRCFSTVFQDYCKYAFNVKESVSLSDICHANDVKKIKTALSKSRVDAFTVSLPHGLDTYLTRRYDESGIELSGGQWQKMAIARAFFREASFYILDEPSASLDAQSENEVFTAFQELYAEKGVILVSNRLSHIHLYDMILVMNNGSLAESGRHYDLMKANGIYAHMYRLQTEKYDYSSC